MSEIPSKTRALVQQGETFVEDTVQLPSLGPHDILVEVHSAAFNPTDMLAFDTKAFGDGAILGCDFAGVVRGTGEKASRFSIGDQVAAFVWGGELKGLGAYRIVLFDMFAREFCIADERVAFKVPENISLEQAATIPLAAATAYLALFSSDCLGLDRKQSSSTPVLVMGGSSTVGSFTNQLAKIHNIETISTCSPKNNDAVLQDGTKFVFDYRDADTPVKIHESFPNLNHIFDTIGKPDSSTSAEHILKKPDAVYCTVRPGKAHTEHLPSNVRVCDVFVFTTFPKEHTYRGKAHWPLHQENVDLGRDFFADVSDQVAKGQIKPKPVKSLGELSASSLKEAMDLTRSGKVSNEKICFTVKGRKI